MPTLYFEKCAWRLSYKYLVSDFWLAAIRYRIFVKFIWLMLKDLKAQPILSAYSKALVACQIELNLFPCKIYFLCSAQLSAQTSNVAAPFLCRTEEVSLGCSWMGRNNRLRTNCRYFLSISANLYDPIGQGAPKNSKAAKNSNYRCGVVDRNELRKGNRRGEEDVSCYTVAGRFQSNYYGFPKNRTDYNTTFRSFWIVVDKSI